MLRATTGVAKAAKISVMAIANVVRFMMRTPNVFLVPLTALQMPRSITIETPEDSIRFTVTALTFVHVGRAKCVF